MPGVSIALAVLLAVVPAWQRDRPAEVTRGLSDLTAALQAADPIERARAACELRELGDRASPAIDALASLLADASPVESSVCGQRWRRGGDGKHFTSPGALAAAALVTIGSRAYEALETAARGPAWAARRNAVWGLGALDDARAVPTLIAALKDNEPPVREQAAWALGAIGDRQAVAALVSALTDTEPKVRRQAAWALGAVGERQAVDGLVKALREDTDAETRAQSAWALGAIGDSRASDSLAAALKDAEVKVRRQAAWALGAVGR